MKTKSRGNIRPAPFLAIALTVSLLIVPSVACGAVRIWTGRAAGADANWTSAANWSNNIVPAPGDFFLFPVGVTKKVVTNNFAINTDFSGFQLDADYTLRGSLIDLTNLVTITATGAVVELGSRLLAHVRFAVSNNANLQWRGPLQLNSRTATFDVDGGPAEVSGIISGATTNSRVIKDGFGSLRLSAANTYAGFTSVALGTLVVNGSITSDMEVQSLATLAGTGSVGNTTNRGRLRPGDGGPGILSINGSCTLSTSASLFVELTGTAAGIDYDQLQVSGAVELGSADLVISRAQNFVPSVGTVFTILNKTSAGAITGIFSGLPQNAITNVGDVFYQISYTGGNGNDVTLTVTALEPQLVTRVWDGGGTGNNWTTAANWQSDIAPVPTNHLEFPRSAPDAICTNNFATDTVFSSLRFTGMASTNNYPLLRGNSIRLLSGIVATNLGSQGAIALELPVKLAASQSFANASTNTAIELPNVVAHPFTLTVRGPGVFRATGTVTATNNANLVVVNGGHLVVNGKVNGNVSVTGGGELAGNGAVGALTVGAADISPGDGGAGILNVAGPLTLSASSTLNLHVNSSTAGTGHDQLVVSNGNVSLGSAFLNLVVASNLTAVVGDTFTVIKLVAMSNRVSGIFAGLPQGAILTNNGKIFRLSYAGGDGNDVALTLVDVFSTGVERQWTGADRATNLWSARSNWVSNVAPLPGDSLHFAASQGSRHTNFNDFPADTTFGLVRFDAFFGDTVNYTLLGNPLRLNDGVRLEPSGTTVLNMTGIVTISNRLTLNRPQTFTNALDATLRFVGGVVLSTNTLFAKVRANTDIFFDAPVTGPGRLETGGGGRVNVNASNEITGEILVGSGVLVARHPQALGSATSGPVRVGSGGILRLQSSNAVFTGSLLVVTGRVEAVSSPNSALAIPVLAAGSNAVMVTSNSPTFFALMAPVTNMTQLTVDGVRLVPTASIEGGGLLRGSLEVDGIVHNVVLPGSLSGAGQIDTVIGTNAFSSIQPGSLTDPALAFAPLRVGRLQLNGNATLQLKLFPNRPGGGPTNTALITTAAPDLGGARLALTALTNLAPNQKFTLLRNDSAAPVTNTFANLPESGFIAAASGNLGLQISYVGGDGNDVVATVQSNTPPVLSLISRFVNEQTTLTFSNSATDPDQPPQTLTWALLSAPPGVNLNPASGVVTWTPAEAQGPSTNAIVLKVTDSGVPPLSSTGTVTVTVGEVNQAPNPVPLPLTNVLVGSTLTLQLAATDSDIPTNPLTWFASLLPSGTTLSTNGLFTFTPTTNNPGTRTFTVSVRDFNRDAGFQQSLTTTLTFSVRIDILRVVTNTNDSGPGSLRQAILDINNSPGGGRIEFNIPGVGPFKIFLITALPPLLRDTVIDGYMQPGSRANTLTNGNDALPLIELSGENIASPTNGLSWSGPRVTVRGLIINRWDTAIATGRSGAGGLTSNAVVEGCFIGTDPSGTQRRTNRLGISFLEASGGRIGGPAPAQRNLISGNSDAGIALVWDNSDSFLHNVTIQNNFIGTDRSGTNALGNGGFGIFSQTTIPTTNSVIADNVIAANGQGGVQLAGKRNFVLRNKIGVGADGLAALGNGGPGIELFGNQHLAGGGDGANGNLIANNNGPGVHVSAGTNHAVLANSIFRNSGLGIDLGTIGPNPNDLGDLDSGPNNLQNTPVLASNIVADSTALVLNGTLQSATLTTYRLEFFHSPDFAPNNQPQGRTFLGSTDVATDGNGNTNFSVMVMVPSISGFITATATDPAGNTSEMSAGAGIQNADFYAGVLPNLSVVSGNNQSSSANLFLSEPLVVLVTGTNGVPLSNAPVTFAVAQGDAKLATSFSETRSSVLAVRTAADGLARVFCHLGPTVGVTDFITATATSAANSTSVTFVATSAQPQHEGMLLQGAPDSPALGAMMDIPPVGVSPNQIEDGIIVTRLDVVIDPQATVAQVNAALTAVGGGIVTMRPGSPFATVAIPPPASIEELQNVAQTLGGAGGIQFVTLGREAEEDLFPFDPVTVDAIMATSHLLPTRFPAAWNASAILGVCSIFDRVPVVVHDGYAPDPNSVVPDLDFNTQIPNRQYFVPPASLASTNRHGYLVSTTLGALFDAKAPTGANPFSRCLQFHLVQVNGLTESEQIEQFARSIAAIPGKFIVNRSMGFRRCTPLCPPRAVINQLDHPITRAWYAVEWMLYTSSRWQDFLYVNSAGNNADKEVGRLYPGTGEAPYNSPAGIAALGDLSFAFMQDQSLWGTPPDRPDLPPLVPAPDATANLLDAVRTLGLDTLGPANNVLTAGSVLNESAPADLEESLFSNRHADVKAVGQNVTLHCDMGRPSLGCPVGLGTSFSAPQVAGLASYLWLLSPELKGKPANATAQIIKANTRTNAHTTGIIDAYATVLALDQAALPTPSTAPIRLALLDVNTDRKFDEADLRTFMSEFALRNGLQDFSRFDLNGDGFTGGSCSSCTERFDLDRVGSTQFGQTRYEHVFQSVEGVQVAFDENALTDEEILCYYAYSALYTGDPNIRAQLVGDICAPVTIQISPPGAVLSPEETQQFVATVSGITEQGVTWSVSGGGTITPNGLFTAACTPTNGTSQVFTLCATSVARTNKFAQATVVVRLPIVVFSTLLTAGSVSRGQGAPPGSTCESFSHASSSNCGGEFFNCLDDGPDPAMFPDGNNFVCSDWPCACETASLNSPIDLAFEVHAASQTTAEAQDIVCFTAPRDVSVAITPNHSWGTGSTRVSATVSGAFNGQAIYQISDGQVVQDSPLPAFSLVKNAVLSFSLDAKCTGNSAGTGNAVSVKISPLVAGTFQLSPTVASVAPLTPINYAFTWTVPEPFNWHHLTELQLRIRDGNNIIFWLRFNEADRTFSLFNEAANRFGRPVTAGSNFRLENSSATLFLTPSSVVASGPTSPTVTLNLALSFKPSTGGRTYSVEAAASDDDGNAEDFIQAGVLTIAPVR
jgi:autotransporter-associated beta strand protein